MEQQNNSGVGRRAVVRTAAWAVPVVATVSAAPAFAGTTPPAPNLSTSTSSATPARNATTKSWIEVPPSSSTLVNTGDADALGLKMVYTSTVAINSIVVVFFGNEIDPTTQGVTFSGLGTTQVIMNVPAGQATITKNGGTYSSAFRLRLKMASTDTATVQISVTAANGGIGKDFPATTVPA